MHETLMISNYIAVKLTQDVKETDEIISQQINNK